MDRSSMMRIRSPTSDLYFKFTVPFEDSEKLGTATIEAYNLSPATRNSIKKGMPIILNAPIPRMTATTN